MATTDDQLVTAKGLANALGEMAGGGSSETCAVALTSIASHVYGVRNGQPFTEASVKNITADKMSPIVCVFDSGLSVGSHQGAYASVVSGSDSSSYGSTMVVIPYADEATISINGSVAPS